MKKTIFYKYSYIYPHPKSKQTEPRGTLFTVRDLITKSKETNHGCNQLHVEMTNDGE